MIKTAQSFLKYFDLRAVDKQFRIGCNFSSDFQNLLSLVSEEIKLHPLWRIVHPNIYHQGEKSRFLCFFTINLNISVKILYTQLMN